MIISASRRTDIPAFYSEWFFNRLKDGFCYTRNPMNPRQLSKIILTPEIVDCFVFWTKDPEPMFARLDELSGFDYYFQYTINPYPVTIEKNVPDLDKAILSAQTLSTKIGKNRLVWRYDPIFITKDFNVDQHALAFYSIAKQLSGIVKRCVISFYDEYKTISGIFTPNVIEIEQIAKEFSSIGNDFAIKIETCSETTNLEHYGICNTKCIDDRLISEIIGQPLQLAKDKGQRSECGCVTSIDIGAYSSCKHGCVYCYAQRETQLQKHFSDSPLLLGKPLITDVVLNRKMESYKKTFIEESF